MLVFIDESYDEKDDPHAKSTFSAVLIQEGRYREFDMKLFDLKKHFWKVGNPYDMELKGRKLLSSRLVPFPKSRFCRAVHRALQRSRGCILCCR